ncbi:MAG: tRNA uridine-5-carboxymethylaminomethyl(34) synthesis GTPase MnmE [Mogibacterium sp.]|nr:tRNA uridine-5-carboxymethylaminomethyl(34) synthesis GTPase MnmE [Mogibacterium sp.]MBR2539949.1 tRNA uridine-5-carboxymethylaminomethyl(34) synthesis GTPase MnmE [Mogibacterium sp.]
MAETIAAISTAPGEGGIGIVRVSGPASLDLMKKLMQKCPEEIEPRHAYFGKVVRDSADPASEVIDEAVFLFMKGPASYTGEDMLEIQGHGSNVSLKGILKAVLESGFEGVRMADPGEFTKLAFLNGKMDLSQAEAVIDIIKAKTDLSLEIAESQREGRLSENIENIRENLMDVLAEMAVNIDYPDEDEDMIGSGDDDSSLVNQLRWVLSDVENLLDTASIGRIAREGVRAVIVGKPNAGKSSLMNALLGEGRVIVTDIPGTTRDTVEENASLGGIPIVLVDTAGLRDTEDKVEKIGIEKTTQAIASADIVILVLDGSQELDEEDDKVIEYIAKMNTDHLLAVINKEDLGVSVSEEYVATKLPNATIIRTSLVGKGAVEAAKTISEAIGRIFDFGSINVRETSIITNERHVQMLRNAVMNIDEAISMLQNGEPLEVAELSAHYAYDALGRIIGEEVGDEVLNTVFSKFCLGK